MKNAWKKYIALLACAAMTLSLAACSGGAGNGPEATTQIPNPMREVEGPAAYEELGLSIAAPDDATDVKYFITGDKLADVRFTRNRIEYTYRAAMGDEDISGVYDTMTPAFDMDMSCDGAIITVSVENAASGGRLARWMANGVTYALWTADDATDDAMRNTVEGLLLKTFAEVAETAGARFETTDFMESRTCTADLDGDGEDETVTIETIEIEYESLAEKLSVTDGDKTASVQMDMVILSAAYATDLGGDGVIELLVSGDVCSGDYCTWLLRYDGEKLIPAEPCTDYAYEDGAIAESAYGSITEAGPDRIVINNNVDMLGTWWCDAQYRLAADLFRLERIPDTALVCQPADDGWRGITTVRELPVTMEGASEAATLPAGAELRLNETDGETYFGFITKDGAKGRIAVVKNNDTWGWYINGVEEAEYFDFLPYAG